MSTWGDIKPVVHYSESKALHERNDKLKPQAHSDYIIDFFLIFRISIDLLK